MLDSKIKTALELYQNGYNCAQSVIGAYRDYLGKSTDLLMDMAAGFGGGMGKLQQTCGAVTGAFMVLSSLNNQKHAGAKDQLDQDIQHFAHLFRKKHGELNCKALIRYDLSSEEGIQQARDDQVFEKRCSGFVEHAVEVLYELLSQDHYPKVGIKS